MEDKDRIVVYGTRWCPDCRRALGVLKDRGLDYDYIDINKDRKARDYVEQVNNGYRSVPTILFPNGKILVEPSNRELRAYVDTLVDTH